MGGREEEMDPGWAVSLVWGSHGKVGKAEAYSGEI